MRIFIFDDEIHGYRSGILTALAGHDLTIATTLDEALACFAGTSSPAFDVWLLDHDLHGFYESPSHPDTGSGWLRILAERNLFDGLGMPRVILHSHNEPGRDSMQAILEDNTDWTDITQFRFSPAYVKALPDLINGGNMKLN